jgi:hypothetical protein
MKRRTRPDTVFEKRESDQTTKLLVRVVLFSARSLPRAKKLNPREADKVKNAPRRGSSSPSCPASASTRAMIQHGSCPLARTKFGQDTSQLHRHEQTAARLGVPRCRRARMRKRKAGKRWRRSGISSACRVTLLFGALHGSCGAHRQARGAVAGGFGQRNCHEHRAGHDPAHSARHGERYAAMMRCRVMGSRVW